jgi:hypothetical protein
MSSSRSIAAARNRRSPESGLQARTPTKQPITSIQSQRAFAPNQSPNNNNTINNNIITPPTNKLPFSKLTVSDAVGLITLRLGKVEQYLIDLQNSDTNDGVNNNSGGIDNSIITTIINRLDALEKKEMSNNNQEIIKHITAEIDAIKHTMRVTETNVSLMNTNINNKLSDIDVAFVELEKCIDNNVSTKLGETSEGDLKNTSSDNISPGNVAITLNELAVSVETVEAGAEAA